MIKALMGASDWPVKRVKTGNETLVTSLAPEPGSPRTTTGLRAALAIEWRRRQSFVFR